VASGARLARLWDKMSPNRTAVGRRLRGLRGGSIFGAARAGGCVERERREAANFFSGGGAGGRGRGDNRDDVWGDAWSDCRSGGAFVGDGTGS